MNYKMILLVSFFISNFALAGFLPIANVSKVKGKASINHEQINVGSEIVSGVEISIPNKNDFIEIKFQNGHYARLTGAQVRVEEFDPKNTLFELTAGSITTTIKALTPNETYKIKTPFGNFETQMGKNTITVNKKSAHLTVNDGAVISNSGASIKTFGKNEQADFKN